MKSVKCSSNVFSKGTVSFGSYYNVDQLIDGCCCWHCQSKLWMCAMHGERWTSSVTLPVYQPSHSLLSASLPLGKPCKRIRAKTARLRNSFFPPRQSNFWTPRENSLSSRINSPSRHFMNSGNELWIIMYFFALYELLMWTLDMHIFMI